MKREIVQVSEEELNIIEERVLHLAKLETEHPGLVISRCNGTNKSNLAYFRKRLKSKEKANNCVAWLEDHGGFCNCEVLFNVYPYLDKYIKSTREKMDNKE